MPTDASPPPPAATDPAHLLRALLAGASTAALATLHKGDPAVSMVPFVVHDGALLLHVSALATHTADMRAHPAVSLLVVAADDPAVPPQARPRASISGEAAFIDRDADAAYADARAAYLARFASAAMMFELADFSLVRITPRAARVVGGFAQAASLVSDRLRHALQS
jgi:hypothetical protein